MRIAFHAPLKSPNYPVPSGDRRIARLFVAALEHAGHDVSLASEFRGYDGAGDPRRQAALAREGAHEAARLIAWYRRPEAKPPALWFTYHVYHKAPDHIGPQVAKALDIPYVIAEASHAPKRAGGPWDLGYRAAAAAIEAADLVLCMTRLDMACVETLLGGTARVRYLPPFLDAVSHAAAGARRAEHRAALAAEFSLDLDTPWLLAVAMMRPGDKFSSYTELADALMRARERDWTLLIVGDGEEAPEVRELFAPMAARCRFLGERSAAELPAIYAAADLYLWPGVNEAFGMAYLEAQAAGLPVLAWHSRGIPDVVADGVGGVLTPAEDADAYAAALARLLASPDERRRLGRGGAAEIARAHGLEAAAARLKAELARIADD